MGRLRSRRGAQLLPYGLCACAAALALRWLAPAGPSPIAFVGRPRVPPTRAPRPVGARVARRASEQHDVGVMIANLGTPEAPTAEAVKSFLSEFLHDPRVVDVNRWLWCPTLHGIILQFRPSRIAKAYESIWTPEGSPLMAVSKKQRDGLASELKQLAGKPVKVVMGMSYGKPSINDAMKELTESGVRKVVVLPLYPQYSSSTTGSIWDFTAKALLGERNVPDIKFVHHYHDDPGYINALATSVREQWNKTGKPDKLLLSFHGIPVRYKNEGDYYNEHCEETARRVAKELGLADEEWAMSFQSQFGNEEWLNPKTDKTMEAWGKQGLGHVNVLCPGFAADCLETVEEINEENREIFQENGGGEFHYIPALNDRADHVSALASIVHKKMVSA